MTKKTLVIHPFDLSTGFLSDIYEYHTDWTVIDSPTEPKKIIKNAIKEHDRIIFLGHGTEYGIIRPPMSLFNNSYIIDSSWVYLLHEKELVGVWCNADKFFYKYGLFGLFTGMIISEIQEAKLLSINCTNEQINESNLMFALSIRDSLDLPNPLVEIKQKYVSETYNPLIEYNHQRIFYKDKK